MSKIFFCYRRREDEFAVQLLYFQLVAAFGKDNIFRDVDGFGAGEKWNELLETRVRECEVMLVLIGPDWLTLPGPGGRRRIDMPEDWVRFEIETALRLDIRVVPVLLQQGQNPTQMPGPADLPESIRALYDCHAVTIRARDFENDVQKLITDLQRYDEQVAEISKVAQSYDALVDDGEWVRAKSLLDEAVVTVGPKRTGHKLLVKKHAAAKLLHTAAKAIERGDFAEAHELLGQVPEPPPAVLASMRFAAIGYELGNGPLSHERVRTARNELKKIARGGSGRIPGEAELLTILDRQEQRLDYETGLEHYRAGRFATAARHLEHARAHEDAGQWLDRIAAWSRVFDSLREGRWSDARAHLRGLHEDDPSRITAVRQWCNFADRYLPVLTEMARGGRLAEPAVPSEAGPISPYAILRVTPSLPHAQALDLFYDHPNEKASCDVLRVPETRLLIDFGTYMVRDPKSAAGIVSRYFSFPADATLDNFLDNILRVFSDSGSGSSTTSQHLFKAIESGLGDDAGILFALQGNHDVAIQRFLEAARRNPADHISLHHLGLAACAKAHIDPAAGSVAEAWNLVCVGWGAVFADDRFWNAWWAQIRKIYPITEKQKVEDARARLEHFWLDELKTVEELGEDSADVFALEARSARAIGELKGIPLGRSSSQRAFVGRRGVTTLNLEPNFRALVNTFSAEQLATAGPQQNVCIAFSRLALPQSLIESGRHADAVAALERIDTAGPGPGAADTGFSSLPGDLGPRFFRESHARLLARAYLELGYAAVARTPIELETAVEHWKAALRAAERCNAGPETLARIREVVVGRARWLRGAQGSKHERLNYRDDAVRLMEEAERQPAWDNEEHDLQHELVESLLDRAVYVSNEFDMEKVARLDALAAYRLRPNYVRAIETLCMASMYYARQLSSEGKRDVATDLVAEVIALLDEKESRFPGHGNLSKIREGAVELKELIAGDDHQTLDRVFKNLIEVARCSEAEPLDRRFEEARQLEAEKNYERATELYWEIVQERPEDHEVRGRMCHCYRLWLFAIDEEGSRAEAQRVLNIARERCATSLQLRDVFESEDEEGGEA